MLLFIPLALTQHEDRMLHITPKMDDYANSGLNPAGRAFEFLSKNKPDIHGAEYKDLHYFLIHILINISILERA
jgi:hypothetical protein